MALRLKALTALPESLGSLPSMYMVANNYNSRSRVDLTLVMKKDVCRHWSYPWYTNITGR